MKTTLSLSIEGDLLNAIKERAAVENESVNAFVEKLLGVCLVTNKYKLKR